jgi:predicted DNA-binding transcriptional regulator AlpA
VEQVITLEHVCALLHISVGTGRNRISNGAPMPPSFRTGRRRLFLASAVDEWIRNEAGFESAHAPLFRARGDATRRGRPRQNGKGFA